MSSSAARFFPRAFGSLSPSDTKNVEDSQKLSDRWNTVRVDFGTPSDEVLMSLVCQGDKEALALLFRRYARVVRSVAYKILRDKSEADDLLQEIFILVHRKSSSFDNSKASARLWILQMTHHRAITRRRYLNSRHFYTRLDLEDVEPQLSDPGNEVERVEQFHDSALKNAALQNLMAGLSDNQQQTLRLYFFEGYTLDEIAVKLGQSRENVRHHYFRGLDRLRRQIFQNHNGR